MYLATVCAAELEIESLSCRVRAKKHVGFPFSESSLHIVARDDAPSAIRIAHLATATGPIAIIGGPKTGLRDPAGIALDFNLNIYVANAGAPGVSVYKPLGSSAGLLNETPIATISGSNTGLSYPQGIAVDSTSGNIYVADEDAPSVYVYPPLESSTGTLN